MNQWTIDVNEENFEAEVLERSTEVPVMVDFWAEWCGPCKVLGPVLEKLADEYAGEFILAKVNVDENQGLAGAFGIQGIPAVKLFKDGDLASEFTGALPEPMLREFLSKFLPTAADKQALEAQALEEEGKTAEAKALYQTILESDPNHAKALLGLGRLAMNEGDSATALEHLDKVPMVADERKEADRLIARLNLQAGGTANEAALREKVKVEPNNIAARFELAQALAGAEKYEEALNEFLTIVKADREFQDDGARKAMIQIFEVLGPDDPLTDKYRSELAKVLFR
ncbi:MAG TPA: thioredoxin [Candidatus Limnocylindrales bacterium]|jgi:putative thioredoxin|nr:thioredoxin [Candidatus Limnocylindrales bacterium]